MVNGINGSMGGCGDSGSEQVVQAAKIETIRIEIGSELLI
jgi:hypothetical protein